MPFEDAKFSGTYYRLIHIELNPNL